MGIFDSLKGLFGGAAGKAGDIGLNTIIKGLTELGGKADGADKTSISGIIDILKKALGSNADLGKIIEKCLPLAEKIGNSDIKTAVLKLLKK